MLLFVDYINMNILSDINWTKSTNLYVFTCVCIINSSELLWPQKSLYHKKLFNAFFNDAEEIDGINFFVDSKF